MIKVLRYIIKNMNTDVGNVLGSVAFDYINMGILLGMVFGAILLLRPVTNRLLRPRQRVWLWFLGWYSGFLLYAWTIYWKIKLLPISFSSLVVPRVNHASQGQPCFLPDINRVGGGAHTIALPGGMEIPVTISDSLIAAAGILFLGSVAGWLVWEWKQSKKLLGEVTYETKFTTEQLKEYGIDRTDVAVYRCKGLATSYVRAAIGVEERHREERFVICLQDELPEDKLRLVLLHEMAHIQLHHPWWKGTCNAILILYWWNPVMWLVYRVTCRDMELDCDEKVLETLEKERHRDYALTLLELATEKPVERGFTAFGECDAALRVHRVAGWKPAGQGMQLLSITLMVLLALFFYCGSWGVQPGEVTPAKENWNWEDTSLGRNDYLLGMEWPNYAVGPRLKNDLKQWLGVEELPFRNVWFSHQGTRDLATPEFWVELEDGGWYHCRAEYVEDDYELTMVEPSRIGPDRSQGQWHPGIIYAEEET